MSDKSKRIILSKGDTIRYKKTDDDGWKTVEVVSKAGKATGEFKNCYNVKDNYSSYYLNLDKIYEFERLSQDGIIEDIEEELQENG